jgi:phthalate 4,5-cis-dihydrodiol dehydrogenase
MGQRSEEASPIVRVAIAGLGAAGCMMIPALLKHPAIKITAAADTDPAPLEKFRGDFQAETFLSVEELDTRLGGGVTFRQGSHQFDLLRLIGGGLVRSVRAMTGVWDARRPTEGSHVVYLEFEDGTPATAVYSGYDRFHTAELTFGIGEQGQLLDASVYGRARKALARVGSADEEAALKRSSVRYGGSRARPISGTAPHPPVYGLTLVSCEKGDIRQSANGLFIYGEETKWEIPLPTDETGRDAVVSELYEAVVNGRQPAHGGRWGKANLEVCLAVLASASARREVFLAHQTATLD